MATPRSVEVRRLGRMPYAEALALQEALLAEVIAGKRGDTLLLLEHTPVITMGRGAKPEHVLLGQQMLQAQGVELFETGRGGDVTYHGPGQVVGYPIFNLNPDRRDVRRYVKNLEEVMIRGAAAYGLSAERIAGLNGAWIGDRKIGAVGVRLRRWCTMHGFAFNVNTDLNAYQLIVPCGIPDKEVTSLHRELGHEVPMDGATTKLAEAVGEVFDASLHWTDG